ncbi:MAG: PepSY-associated TM helix domain-containing protein [Acidobacteriota bacterium]
MKTLRRAMAEFHTWTGLLLGWLMFAMFTTGTSAYFLHEITRWMEPEVVDVASSPSDAANRAVAYLERNAPQAASWFITLPDERRVRTEVRWRSGERGVPQEVRVLDGGGEEVGARETKGGYFLYRFHFDLHFIPALWARFLVGIAAMFMLVSLISGVLTHRAIFTRFFSLSWGKGVTSWFDAHNMTAVFALPFFLMITYTGLVTLAYLYMPFGGMANFTDGGYFALAYPRPPTTEAAGEAASMAEIGAMVSDAQAIWGGVPPETLDIRHPGDRNAVVHARRSRAGSIGTRMPTLSFSGVTGEPVGEVVRPYHGPLQAESVLVGLHAGRFASVGLRWLYFLSGVLGMAMIGTGLVQWTARRRRRLASDGRRHVGFWIVERLNVVTIAGLGAGLGGYFLANRLLPLELPKRAEWEVHSLFIVWAAVGVWALVRPARRAWPETLALASAIYAAVPVANAFTTDRGLASSLASGDGVFVAFDVMMLLLGGAYGVAALVSSRSARSKVSIRARGQRPAAELPSAAEAS